MGKTPKPLRVLAYSPVSEWPELAEWEAQGHTIIRFNSDQVQHEIDPVDLILGPAAHHMDEPYRKYLDLAKKEAWRRKYPKADKETDE